MTGALRAESGMERSRVTPANDAEAVAGGVDAVSEGVELLAPVYRKRF